MEWKKFEDFSKEDFRGVKINTKIGCVKKYWGMNFLKFVNKLKFVKLKIK